MEDRAKTIFTTAKSYAKAARTVNSSVENDPAQLLPSLVIAALALELYFKSLYFLEKNQDFKVSGRHSHDFFALFGHLSAASRGKLSQEFENQIINRDMKDVKAIERTSETSIPLKLEENLKSWSDVFTTVRYIYDRPKMIKHMMFFPEIEQAAINTVLTLHPEIDT